MNARYVEGVAIVARKAKPGNKKKADAILTADRHLTLRQPICRTDDFVGAMIRKLEFIWRLQQQHDDCPILDAGDFFDHWYLDRGEQLLLTMIMPHIHNTFCVPGQHDLPQHNIDLYIKSNLAVLEEAGCIKILNSPSPDTSIPLITCYGFPWNKEPESVKENEGIRKIALIHRMTYSSKPPYPGAENDGGTAKSLIRKMRGFDLIVSGDNHETFTCQQEGLLLVNPGSMMRMTAKQEDHEPCVFLWYADDNSVERIVLPHEKGVISREHIDQKQERDDRIAAWVERIGQGDIELELGFKENVERHIKKHRIPDAITTIIREVTA